MNKKIKYKKSAVMELPNNKPSLYTITTQGGNHNYVGVAKRGRLRERITEHLEVIPGASVAIKQFSSIQEAKNAEQKAISRIQPKYNKQGK